MKLQSISSLIHNRRGEIGTIAVLVGMVVIGLGILVGSQIRNQNINIGPRASANIDPLWNGALSSKTIDPATDVYLWSNGGPTTGWESYIGNRAYLCNGKFCWTLNRDTAPPTWENGGKPFNMETDSNYSNTQPIPGTDIKPGSQGGPSAAWTWVLPTQMNGYTVNETLVCKGVYCWRYIRYPNGANQTSGWRDGGAPLNMKEAGIWKDDTKMWAGSGLSVGWNDPINGKATLCNESQNYCRSMSYKNGQWAWLNDAVTYPSGVTKFTSAWTSPATNIQTRCTANSCYNFNSSSNAYEGSAFLIAAQPTNTVAPTVRQCASGQLLCANTCTTVTNNNQHCGACGRACSPGLVCSNSTCVAPTPTVKTCAAGQLLCANTCTTVTNNNQHCGACGKVCGSGLVCSNSTCVTAPATRLATPVLSCTNLAGGVKYNWNAVTGANNYNLEVIWTNTGGDSQQGIFSGDVGNITTKTITSTNYGANFQARLIAKNGTNTSLVSNTVNCTVIQPSGNIKVTIPSAPNGAQWRTLNVNDRATAWRNSGQTEPRLSLGYYKIEFKDVAGFTKPVTMTGVTVLNGNTTEKTSASYVPLPTPTCIPNLVSPANNASITSNPSFEWSTCYVTNTKYRLEVTGNSTPSTVSFVGTKYSFTNPVPTWIAGKTYSWKVKVCPNADCIGGTYSATRTFTYNSIVNTPTITVAPTARPTSIPTTIVPTARPTVIVTIPNTTVTTVPCPKKPQGDANCDGNINLADYSCIVGELSNRKPLNCKSSDFDGVGGARPTSADYTIWSNSYNPRN